MEQLVNKYLALISFFCLNLRLHLLLFLCWFTLVANAQIQQGYVKTLGRPNQKGMALGGVSIRAKGTHNAVLSNSQGIFSMSLPGKKNGESYQLQQVQKQGYELSEQGMLGRNYAFSDKVSLTITMVNSRQLQADKQRIENKAYEVAERNYKSRLAALEKQRDANSITIENYREQLQELQNRFDKYQSLIEGLADHYAHVDYDNLDEAERTINLCIENGDLERADSLLQQLGVYNRVEEIHRHLQSGEKLMAEANQDMAAVMKQQDKDAEYLYQLYTIALAKFDNDKARFYIEIRAELDTTVVEWQYEVSNFLAENLAEYSEALKYAQRCLTINESQSSEDSIHMVKSLDQVGTMLYYKGDYDNALQYYNRARNILKAYPSVLTEDVVETYICFGTLYDELSGISSARGSADYAVAFRELAKEAYMNALKTCEKLPYISPYYWGGCFYCLGLVLEKEMMFSKINNDETSYLNKNMQARKYFDKAIVEWSKDKVAYAGLIATAKMQMAITALNNNDLLKQYSDALELLKEVYSEQHPHVATCFMGMADAYRNMDDLKKSYDCYQSAYIIREKMLGEKHESTLFAKRCMERIREIKMTGLPLKYDPYNIIEKYRKTKDLDKILDDILESKEMLEKYSDSIWILPMELYENMGMILIDQKEYSDAVQAYSNAVWIKGQTNPDKDDSEFQKLSRKFIDICKKAEDYHTGLLFIYNLVLTDYLDSKEEIESIFQMSEEYIKYNPDDTEVIEQFRIVKDKYTK